MTKLEPKRSSKTQTNNPSVVLTRVFDAPRELVFKSWTDPEHMAQWWGPHGFTTPVCELDVRPDRFDIGIKLKGVAPAGRLEAAVSWNNMVSHRVRISDPKQIDAKLLAWLEQAYDAA